MAAGKWDFEQSLLVGTLSGAVFGGKLRPNPFRPPPSAGLTPEQRKAASDDAWDDLRIAMKAKFGKKQAKK